MSADNSPRAGLGHPDSSIAAALAASTPRCTPKSQSRSTSINPFVQGGLSLLDLILQPLLTHQVTSGAAHTAVSGAHERLPRKRVLVRSLSRPRRTRGRYLARVGGAPEPLGESVAPLCSRSSWRRANSSGASRRRPQNAVWAPACCGVHCGAPGGQGEVGEQAHGGCQSRDQQQHLRAMRRGDEGGAAAVPICRPLASSSCEEPPGWWPAAGRSFA